MAAAAKHKVVYLEDIPFHFAQSIGPLLLEASGLTVFFSEAIPVMATSTIRVLVVDDSALIRAILCDHIEKAPGMTVVGTAADGEQALEQIKATRPDVVTLDVQMPHMDGLTALDAILAKYPLPILMISALTQAGAAVALDSLDRGAMDYLPKPDPIIGGAPAFRHELLRKIRTAAGTDVRRILEIRRERKQRTAAPVPLEPRSKAGARSHLAELVGKCIAIGISTGGPPALSRVFESLRPPLPPIVVVQHMPPNFTRPLAQRLNALSELTIREAGDGDLLKPNHVLIARGGSHMRVCRCAKGVSVEIIDAPPVSSHRPSVDVLMASVAEVFGANTLGVIMTGMGHDGVQGCADIREAGGYVLGQDEATSDVLRHEQSGFPTRPRRPAVLSPRGSRSDNPTSPCDRKPSTNKSLVQTAT